MIWFSSDSHFGHKQVIKNAKRLQFMTPAEYDQFLTDPEKLRISDVSIQRMDQSLIESINGVVGENDILWHLGDFCYPSNPTTAQRYRRQIKCKFVNLVWGNHDRHCISRYFSECHERYDLKLPEIRLCLSHYAQVVWRGMHKGVFSCHLFGHSHSNLNEWMENHMPESRSMDVGVDNAYKLLGEYRPFSLDDVKQFLYPKHGTYADHHQPPKTSLPNLQ